MTVDSGDFQIGRVVSRTFRVLVHNAPVFLLLAAVLTVPTQISDAYFIKGSVARTAVLARGGFSSSLLAATLSQSVLATLFRHFVSIVFGYLLEAALVQGTLSYLNDEKPSLAACLSAGFRYLLPLIALGVLTFLGEVVGFILLIVPGIVLALMWCVVVPIFVVEHPGLFASFGRSRMLTKGHRWQILWLGLLYVFLAYLVSAVVALPMGASLIVPGPANYALPYLIVDWVVSVPLMALAAIGIASVYYELRLVKEGVGPQQLAAAFD